MKTPLVLNFEKRINGMIPGENNELILQKLIEDINFFKKPEPSPFADFNESLGKDDSEKQRILNINSYIQKGRYHSEDGACRVDFCIELLSFLTNKQFEKEARNYFGKGLYDTVHEQLKEDMIPVGVVDIDKNSMMLTLWSDKNCEKPWFRFYFHNKKAVIEFKKRLLEEFTFFTLIGN